MLCLNAEAIAHTASPPYLVEVPAIGNQLAKVPVEGRNSHFTLDCRGYGLPFTDTLRGLASVKLCLGL